MLPSKGIWGLRQISVHRGDQAYILVDVRRAGRWEGGDTAPGSPGARQGGKALPGALEGIRVWVKFHSYGGNS